MKQTQKLNRRSFCVSRHVQHRAFPLRLPRRGSRGSGYVADLSQCSFGQNSNATSLVPLPRQDSHDSEYTANLSQCAFDEDSVELCDASVGCETVATASMRQTSASVRLAR